MKFYLEPKVYETGYSLHAHSGPDFNRDYIQLATIGDTIEEALEKMKPKLKKWLDQKKKKEALPKVIIVELD